MKEHPILFSTPMVQAILDGRKTMTRRVVKPQPIVVCGRDGKAFQSEYCLDGFQKRETENGRNICVPCPYGKIGDVLWVRETWQETTWMHKDDEFYGYIYKASENGKAWAENTEDWKWKPSIFMPKAACRIKLRITGIRVEQLNEINGNGSWEKNPWVWVIEFEVIK